MEKEEWFLCIEYIIEEEVVKFKDKRDALYKKRTQLRICIRYIKQNGNSYLERLNYDKTPSVGDTVYLVKITSSNTKKRLQTDSFIRFFDSEEKANDFIKLVENKPNKYLDSGDVFVHGTVNRNVVEL